MHTPADLGAHTYRLVDAKAVGRLQSVYRYVRNFTPTVGLITPFKMLNRRSALICSRRKIRRYPVTTWRRRNNRNFT